MMSFYIKLVSISIWTIGILFGVSGMISIFYNSLKHGWNEDQILYLGVLIMFLGLWCLPPLIAIMG